MKFSSIEEAITDLKNGRMVIAVDNENRENEGDLIIPAQYASPDKINFLIQKGRGLVCIAMLEERLLELELEPQRRRNMDTDGCKFYDSVDLVGSRSGVSAYERSETVQALIDPRKRSSDFKSPGHMFPLRYQEGGVLARQGHTEASVDLCKLAGLYPAAVICEVMADDGHAAKTNRFSAMRIEYGIGTVKIDDLIAYRKEKEKNSI